jgi:hypothetical protein
MFGHMTKEKRVNWLEERVSVPGFSVLEAFYLEERNVLGFMDESYMLQVRIKEVFVPSSSAQTLYFFIPKPWVWETGHDGKRYKRPLARSYAIIHHDVYGFRLTVRGDGDDFLDRLNPYAVSGELSRGYSALELIPFQYQHPVRVWLARAAERFRSQ